MSWAEFLESVNKKGCSKKGIVVSFVHWILCNNKFGNVGTGEEFEGAKSTDPNSELPIGWKNGDVPLRYIDTETKHNFVLRVFSSSGDHLQITLTRAADQETTSLCLKLSDILSKDDKSIGYPLEWASKVNEALWMPFRPKKGKQSSLLESSHFKPMPPTPSRFPSQPNPGGPYQPKSPFSPKPRFDPPNPFS